MPIVNGTSYGDNTSPDVIAVLESVRKSGQRIRIYYGNPDSGVVWDDLPMRGKIARSMGPTKIPLLAKTVRSYGGEGILDHCVVKIETSPYKSVLYIHPNVARRYGRK